MLTKILLPTDGSENSLRAAKMALQLAERNGSQVEILVVAPQLPIIASIKADAAPPGEADQLYEENTLSQQIVADTAALFQAKGVPYQAKILTGSAAEVIIQEAESTGCDLIIIGTRGATGISRFLLGSVSSRVVKYAPCSVLVVR